MNIPLFTTSLKSVPDEVACTSTSRQWGIPTDNPKYPKPVIDTSIKKGEKSTYLNIVSKDK